MPRPRFSLLNLLLLTTIVALGLTTGMLWREVGPLRQEVQQLRNETGKLIVEDPTRLAAVQCPQTDELSWKWRVWLPAGHNYLVRTAGDDGGQVVPATGFIPSLSGQVLESGTENVIEYRIRRDLQTDVWRGSVRIAGQLRVTSGNHDWVDWPMRCSKTGGVNGTTESQDAKNPMVLMRFQIAEVNRSDEIPDPARGFLIWIEPQ
ncbi:hypothetical protein Pla175_09660 [Pirellulimonas nuda]|uniref:Uncharacterized protein n=1 Tax=Pirellulimonas nuda TaxID=2528009 RepID=A0A518D7Z0_9BACT|nr:hypothetical protein [Pirellulimonas nuda]QDU87601.1 hypothetical protein Pla175_09660 [Pirellulimonas nuda]